MRSVHFAEWILRLVTSSDRAASTVGDFVEETPSRGAGWFWCRVLRTAASMLWRGVTESPGRVAGVALVGLAVDVAGTLLLAALSGIVFFAATWNGVIIATKSAWWILFLSIPLMILSLVVGRVLARLAPGRELAACLVYAILGLILTLGTSLIFSADARISFLISTTLGDAIIRTPFLVGAVWGRQLKSY